MTDNTGLQIIVKEVLNHWSYFKTDNMGLRIIVKEVLNYRYWSSNTDKYGTANSSQ